MLPIGFFSALLIIILTSAAFFMQRIAKINNRPIGGFFAPFVRVIFAIVFLFITAAAGHFLWVGFIYLKQNVF